MALDNAHGFSLVQSQDDVLIRPFIVTSAAVVQIGDVVIQGSTAGTVSAATAAGEHLWGVCLDSVTGDGTKTARIVIDPMAIYRVQVANTGAFPATNVGKGHDIGTFTAGSTNTSGMELDPDEATNSGEGQFLLLGIAAGTAPYAAGAAALPGYGTSLLTEAIVMVNPIEFQWTTPVT